MCSSSMHSVPGYPDSAFERARAYIAGPVAPEDGLTPALKWAFQHHSEGRWKRIGILVPGQECVREHRGLHRLRTRGVTVEAATDPRPLAGFTGPVIAYCPNLYALAVAERLPITCGIVAVAADNAPLRPWVHAFTPQHLAGQADPADVGTLELRLFEHRFGRGDGRSPPVGGILLRPAGLGRRDRVLA